MKKILLLLAIYCVYGIGAHAQIQQDNITADGWGNGGGGGGSGDIEAVGTCVTGSCAIEGGNDMFPFIYEGTDNGFETTFSVTDPTDDNTIVFPDGGGDVCLTSAVQTLTNKTFENVSGDMLWEPDDVGNIGDCGDEDNRPANVCAASGMQINGQDVPTVSSTSTLTNKTLTSPDITTQTSLPTCDSDNEGKTDYVKVSNSAGFPVMCVNNRGYYELQPMGKGNIGYTWYETDIYSGANDSDRVGGLLHVSDGISGTSPETNHPGLANVTTGGTINTNRYIHLTPGDSTSNGWFYADDNYKCELIFQTGANVSDYLLTAGSMSDVDDPDDTHVAFIEYDTGNADTNWQAVTRDSTGEIAQTKTDTGVTVSTSTWYRVLIEKNGLTNTKFYLASGNNDYTLVATHTTDLPTGVGMGCGLNLQNLAAAIKTMKVDYLRGSQLGITR